NLDPTRTQPAQSSHMCLGGLEVADDEPGRTFELFARLTEGDSTSDAMEECDSEFVLEAFDRLGQRRLRDEEGLRGLREAAGVDDGEEMADLTNIHRPRLSNVSENSLGLFHCRRSG